MSDDKGDQTPKHRRFAKENYDHWLDQQINQAQSNGAFDKLEGTGKRQNLGDDALVPEHERLGYRMLKTSGFAPPWVEARKDLDEQRAEIDQWLARVQPGWDTVPAARRAVVCNEYRDKLKALQSAILTYNLRLPPGIAHLPSVRIDVELRKLPLETDTRSAGGV